MTDTAIISKDPADRREISLGKLSAAHRESGHLPVLLGAVHGDCVAAAAVRERHLVAAAIAARGIGQLSKGDYHNRMRQGVCAKKLRMRHHMHAHLLYRQHHKIP